MNVLVNGIGNIGTTLVNILNDFRNILKITEVYALKNTKIQIWNSEELEILKQKGIKICTRNKRNGFLMLDHILDSIDYIFDCNANTIGLKNRKWYESLPNLKGCSAQGSEKGFGTPYMSGMNDEIIQKEKFVQVVSCNTHSLASIITTLVPDINSLEKADFVIVRRSEDLGSHSRLVSASVVSRHLSDTCGTHHAIDVKELFATINKPLNIQSSDVTTPSQLMHSVRFSLKLKTAMQSTDIQTLIQNNPFVSYSTKFDSNVIFESGRRYGYHGRLYSHSIIIGNNLLFEENNTLVKGWAFIPQEGNTILSTLNAYVLQLKIENHHQIMQELRDVLVRKFW